MGAHETHEENLDFFNRLSGRLKIDRTEEPVRISPKLENRAAPPSASVVSVSLEVSVYENDDFRELTAEEWQRPVLRSPRIRMCNGRVPGTVVEHTPADGATFTIRDLAAAVENTERHARADTEWFGGVDVHHRYFEGIRRDEAGVWHIHWGS